MKKQNKQLTAERFYQTLENKTIKAWRCKKHDVLVGTGQNCPMCQYDNKQKLFREYIKKNNMYSGTTTPERREEILALEKKRTRENNKTREETKEAKEKAKRKRLIKKFSHSL